MKQNRKPINLFEYSEYHFDEPLTGKIALLLNKRCSEINTHTKRDVLRPIHNNSNQTVGIKSFQYVGVISIHPTLTIQILPKMYNPREGEDKWQQSIQNLLYMLNYCGKLLNTHTKSTQLKSLKGDFYEILIYLYASTLLNETRNSLHHEYITQEQNLPYLKGKVLFSKHLLNNLTRQNLFYLKTDEFDPNNQLNRVFAYVSRQLYATTSNIKNRQLLSELNLLLSEVAHGHISQNDANKIHINRMNERFRPALDLAKLFLSGSTLQLTSNTFKTATFLIDMNNLFEDFIAKLVKQQADENSIVYTQGPHEYLVTGEIVSEESIPAKIFQMRPDITIANKLTNLNEHVIDTKYKILDNQQRKLGISQTDLYQMYAYSHKYKVKDITLLYPEQSDESIGEKSYVLDDTCTVHIRTINLNRDVRSHLANIKDEIRFIVKPPAMPPSSTLSEQPYAKPAAF